MTTAPNWNFGDILDALDASFPGDAPALIHADRVTTWRDFGRRSNNLARAFAARGAQPGDKVAFYLRNRPEYCEALAACFKARLVHVNVNYRYLDEELWYILDNSDAKIVVYDADFAGHVEKLRPRLPRVAAWVKVGEGAGAGESFEALAETGDGRPLGIERDGQDLLFLYTGGTTGMPKGVMWAANDLWHALGAGANAPANGGQAPATLEQHVANMTKLGPATKQIPCCPLMHGTGLFTAIGTLVSGGCVITLAGQKFDSAELFDVVQKHKANSLVIVGDAFAKPMLNALEENPGRWDISSVKLVVSSGVMWSTEVKKGMLRHNPGMILTDSFGSSEAVGFGVSIMTAAGEVRTAKFTVGDRCKVFSEDHREIAPGSGEKGFIARSGPIPVGYYKDPEKTAKTFPTINGVRYSIPGDWCIVEADGTLTLLGRGSACINSAGEKIYPEEVEEALKTHPDVEDALVVGVPDDRWGNAVIGVVQLRRGAATDEEKLRSHVKDKLAGYKVPTKVFGVPAMFRAPNGKADYKSAQEFAAKQYAP